jgi:hypothetical protein
VFERNRVETFDRGDGKEKVSLAVEIFFDDGRTASGHIIAPAARGLSDVLNSGGAFVEFEPAAGERAFLAKSSIRSVRPRLPVRTDQLERKLKSVEASDPYRILGVDRSAGPAAVREAYLNLAKTYHPDRLQGLSLPREMLEYGGAMAKRINAAYAALSGTFSGAQATDTDAPSRRPAPFHQ